MSRPLPSSRRDDVHTDIPSLPFRLHRKSEDTCVSTGALLRSFSRHRRPLSSVSERPRPRAAQSFCGNEIADAGAGALYIVRRDGPPRSRTYVLVWALVSVAATLALPTRTPGYASRPFSPRRGHDYARGGGGWATENGGGFGFSVEPSPPQTAARINGNVMRFALVILAFTALALGSTATASAATTERRVS